MPLLSCNMGDYWTIYSPWYAHFSLPLADHVSCPCPCTPGGSNKVTLTLLYGRPTFITHQCNIVYTYGISFVIIITKCHLNYTCRLKVLWGQKWSGYIIYCRHLTVVIWFVTENSALSTKLHWVHNLHYWKMRRSCWRKLTFCVWWKSSSGKQHWRVWIWKWLKYEFLVFFFFFLYHLKYFFFFTIVCIIN